MSADHTTCPEDANSTDCLLRAVLEAVKGSDPREEVNWDPLTFIFTLLIGAIALTFAGTTVLQGILTASPCRRKSSFNAIGPWSRFTRARWNWRELRREFYTCTPVFSIAHLDCFLQKEENRKTFDRLVADHCTIAPPMIPKHNDCPQSPESLYGFVGFTATWMQLLFYGGIHVAFAEVYGNDCGPLKLTAVERLGPEVYAVPAYAEVSFVVLLAAVVGCDQLRIETDRDTAGYPLITGSSMQVVFRRDGALGIVAVFERYTIQKTLQDPLSAQLLKQNAYLFKANVSAADWLANNRIPPSYAAGAAYPAETIINGIEVEHPPFRSCVPGKVENPSRLSGLCSPSYLLRDTRLELAKGGWLGTDWLLFSSPSQPPLVFPARKLKLVDTLDALLAQSKFWRSIRHTGSNGGANVPLGISEADVTAGRKWIEPLAVGYRPNNEKWRVFYMAISLVSSLQDGSFLHTFQALPSTKREELRKAAWDELQSIIAIPEKETPGLGCILVELSVVATALQRFLLFGKLTKMFPPFYYQRNSSKKDGEEITFSKPLQDGSSSWTITALDNVRKFFELSGYEAFEDDLSAHGPLTTMVRTALLFPMRASADFKKDHEASVPLFRWLYYLAYGKFPKRNKNNKPGDPSSLGVDPIPVGPDNDGGDDDDDDDDSADEKSLYHFGDARDGNDMRPWTTSPRAYATPVEFILKTAPDPTRQLIIYRTVLLSLLLITAMDNSDIIDTGIGDKIVPFL